MLSAPEPPVTTCAALAPRVRVTPPVLHASIVFVVRAVEIVNPYPRDCQFGHYDNTTLVTVDLTVDVVIAIVLHLCSKCSGRNIGNCKVLRVSGSRKQRMSW